MSELLHRAIDDLDGRTQGGFPDARRALLEEVRQGADARRLISTVNEIEMQPGHAHQQIAAGVDRQGYLDIVPASYAGDQGQPPPPPVEATGPVVIQQGPSTGEIVGGAIIAGTAAALIGRALGGGRENYYHRGQRW